MTARTSGGSTVSIESNSSSGTTWPQTARCTGLAAMAMRSVAELCAADVTSPP